VNHADIKKHLADYLEGELQIDERALVDAHLDACDSCAGEVEEMLRTIRLLRTLPEPETPPMIAANVMRRVRSGEGRLGFYGRLGRTLGAVLEPGFVLPASAIAAAALVIAVVQGGLDVFPTSDATRDPRSPENTSAGGTGTTVASLSPSFTSSRDGDRARALRGHRTTGGSNGMDFVARVKRRATQSDRTLQAAGGQRTPFTASRSGARIRIRFEGLDLARIGLNQSSPPRGAVMRHTPGMSTSFGGPVLTSRSPAVWTTDFSKITAGNASGTAFPGTLVAARRLGVDSRSPVWPQTGTQGEFLTSAGNTGGETSTGDATREGDPRDAWLALAFEDPAEFARYIAGRNLAEQELWAARLSERAEARGFLDEFLQALRESGDPTAAWVADDFSAQAERAQHRFSKAQGQPTP